MKSKYKCLILDHDDTAVDSTAHIHYPSHVETLKQLRPSQTPIGLDGWYLKNFHPGIMEYLQDELKFSDSEIQVEYEIWRSHTSSRIPRFYPGFLDLLSRFKSEGGIITVVSHSDKDLIQRDYRHWGGSNNLMPEMVFGWDYDSEKRKPSPWPVRQILKTFGLHPEEVLILDDLKPGVVMGKRTNIAVAAAGWGHAIPVIREFMLENTLGIFDTIEEFEKFLFNGG